MLHGYIVDPETGKNVAVIRHGEVFRDDKKGARIGIVLNANLYDLSGNLVGRLDGQQVIDVRTWSMPIAFRNLLEGKATARGETADVDDPRPRRGRGPRRTRVQPNKASSTDERLPDLRAIVAATTLQSRAEKVLASWRAGKPPYASSLPKIGN